MATRAVAFHFIEPTNGVGLLPVAYSIVGPGSLRHAKRYTGSDCQDYFDKPYDGCRLLGDINLLDDLGRKYEANAPDEQEFLSPG
jgi:hypothetical protein